MYPNVKAELARRDITLSTLADRMEMSLSTLSGKLKEGRILLGEAKKIKKILETDLPIEVLFEEAR